MARPITITPLFGAEKDTSIVKFGTASLDVNQGFGTLETTDASLFLKDTDTFTIEMWIYPLSSDFAYLWSSNFYNTPDAYFALVIDNQNIKVQYSSDGSNIFSFSGTETVSSNAWSHVALTSDGAGNWTIWVNGQLDTTSNVTIFPGTVGYNRFTSTFAGYADEVRVSSVERYFSNFSVPTQPFVNDNNTLLLVHMDGADGSTTFVDDDTPVPESPFYIEPGYIADGYFEVVGLVEAAASFAVTSTTTANVGRIREADSELDSTVTLTSDGERLRGVDAQFDSTVTLTSDGERLRGVDAAFVSTVTLDSTANAIRDVDAALDTAFTQDTVAGRLQQATATLAGAFSPTVVVRAIRTTDTVMDASFTMLPAVNVQRDANVLLEFFADLNAQADRTRGVDSTANANFTASVSPTATFDAEATLVSSVTLVVDVVSATSVTIANEFTLDANATVIRDANAQLDSDVTVNVSAGVVVTATASLDTTVSLVATGRIPKLDNIVYVIPNESRSFIITPENRTYSIVNEVRTHTIQGDS